MAMREDQGTQLVPVRSSVERFFLAWFLVLIPAMYTLRLAVEYAQSGTFPHALYDGVKIASEIALLVMFALAKTLLATLNPAIVALFSNAVVSPGGSGLSETLAACERSIDSLLNHYGRIVFGWFVAFTTFCYYVTRMGGLPILGSTDSLLTALDVVLYFGPTVYYAYFVGIIAWKLLFTSFFFWSFPRRYAVVPRFLHPDGASGLLPVGDLCLRMMYVAVIPTALSAFFLLTYFVPQRFSANWTPNETLLVFFSPLILLGGVSGLVIGFVPLYRFHLEIAKYRDEWTAQLRALAERIIAEKAKVFRRSDTLGEPAVDAVPKTLAELQSLYQASRKVRMWPVDSGLVARIWGSVALVSGQLLAFIETFRKFTN